MWSYRWFNMDQTWPTNIAGFTYMLMLFCACIIYDYLLVTSITSLFVSLSVTSLSFCLPLSGFCLSHSHRFHSHPLTSSHPHR